MSEEKKDKNDWMNIAERKPQEAAGEITMDSELDRWLHYLSVVEELFGSKDFQFVVTKKYLDEVMQRGANYEKVTGRYSDAYPFMKERLVELQGLLRAHFKHSPEDEANLDQSATEGR
jgi:hypothetical protein